MKDAFFHGDSRDVLRGFPVETRKLIGFELTLVQKGEYPTDYKPVSTLGTGVLEIRVKDQNGAFRVFYVAKFGDAVHVLHAYKKQTEQIPRDVANVVKRRYRALVAERAEAKKRRE